MNMMFKLRDAINKWRHEYLSEWKNQMKGCNEQIKWCEKQINECIEQMKWCEKQIK
jgi:hypothetical protein